MNGYNAGMRGMKNSEYDGGHRTPFFLHFPEAGITGGRDISMLTANIDVLPTLMELCGIKQIEEHDFDGISLVPLILETADHWEDRIIVTDSQRLAYPLKWRKSSTMTQRWRLINGVELYDMLEDPEQRNNIAEQHPDVVKRLRAAYEKWWQLVSSQFDEEIPIPIGFTHPLPLPGEEETPEVLLTTHDWRNDACACAWNQGMIRKGRVCNGYWEIEVVTPGDYQFELRRWPREEDRALTEGIPGDIVDWFTGGRAIPIKTAHIKIGDREEIQVVQDQDKKILFRLRLDGGPTHLQTWLLGKDDTNLGAYYVYVKAI
jgi:hypothetical protein